MLTEIFLKKYATRLAHRYLTSKATAACSPPQPVRKARYLLYIHIPFCEEMCPFCSFLRVKFEPSLAKAYFDALKKEMDAYYNLGYSFSSIYVGGGTPTIVPDKLADIVLHAKSLWPIDQVSVETNPSHLTGDILGILKDIGTNRLSVGVQSFDDGILKSVQRYDKYGSGQQIRQKLSAVAGMFDTLNVDMIFNFPNQTAEMLTTDVNIIKELQVDQVTWYPLIISKARKQQMVRSCGRMNPRGERRLYDMLTKELADTYNAESVWCFSNRPGLIDEYSVSHDDYAGLGAGSMGYVNGTLCFNTFSIPDYIRMIEQDKSPVLAMRNFSPVERMRFSLLLKLLTGSMSLSAMKAKYGKHFGLYLCPELLVLFITRYSVFRNGNIVLTAKGRYCWLSIMRTLFSTLGDYRDLHTPPPAFRRPACPEPVEGSPSKDIVIPSAAEGSAKTPSPEAIPNLRTQKRKTPVEP